MLNQDKMPIVEAIKKYKESQHVRLHIPGHKGNAGMIEEYEDFMSESALMSDITEIRGFDDFHMAEGIIKEARELAAELYGADDTYFLVNGTTSGIMAAVAAVSGEGNAVLVSRECHKSVVRGLVLSGASPVYIQPDIDCDSGLPAGVAAESIKKAFERNPGARALVVTHPSYYGTYSDIRKITEIAHEYGAAVIVDEAHGSHLRFTNQADLPDAMSAGADISVQSTHKMTGSLTQSSMLHVKGELVNRNRLDYFVGFMNSTSPSYLLMSSLDAVRHRMAANGNEIWKNISSITTEYADRISEIHGINCIRRFTAADGQIRDIEYCRIVFSAVECGLSGDELSELLSVDYGIDVELSDNVYCVAVMGTNTREDDLAELYSALKDIAVKRYPVNDSITSHNTYERLSCLNKLDDYNVVIEKHIASDCTERNDSVQEYKKSHYMLKKESINGKSDEKHCDSEDSFGVYASDEKISCSNSISSEVVNLRHEAAVSPREAVMSPRGVVDIRFALGRISAREIAVYPPGIPLIQPGELFSEKNIEFILAQVDKGVHIHGVDCIMEEEKKIMVAVAEDKEQATLFSCIF